MKRNVTYPLLLIGIFIRWLMSNWNVVFMLVACLFCFTETTGQQLSSERPKNSLEVGFSFRVFDKITEELNLTFVHKDKYGFQFGFSTGTYSMNNLNGEKINSFNYGYPLGLNYQTLAFDYRVNAIYFRPSFFVVKSAKKLSVINGVGLNYCVSRHTLVTRDFGSSNVRPVDDLIDNKETFAMEFYRQYKYYLTSRFNLSLNVLVGLNNIEPMVLFSGNIPVEESQYSFKYYPGYGYVYRDVVYANCWVGFGYKFVK